MDTAHRSVMLHEAIDLLQPQFGKWIIDTTFGSGGHTAALLEKGANIVAFDWDEEAIQRGTCKFVKELEAGRLVLIHSSFARVSQEWNKISANKQLAGILFDFGTSTEQLMSEERGFSFTGNGPLDMRMDTKTRGVTAADMLNLLTEPQLVEILQNYGGEEEARRIVRAIKANTPVTTTGQLAEIVGKAKRRHTKLHPATKVFQALRIAVNTELDEINEALPGALDILLSGGRIVAISFHDGEDRIVKRLFRAWAQEGKGELLMKKPLAPSSEEITANIRARSAKLRAFQKN